MTGRESGGLYRPGDLDSKTGLPVVEVLRQKHPDAAVPDEHDFDVYLDDVVEPISICCYEEDVARQVPKLGGSAGPSGVDAQLCERMLLRYGVHSEKLRMEIAQWVMLLANGSPSYATYRALNAATKP